MTEEVVLRRLADDDSIAELTTLLRRAYGPLAEGGLRFVATYQAEETTRIRSERGECWVGELDGRLVATVTLSPPGSERSERAPAWYHRDGVATFG